MIRLSCTVLCILITLTAMAQNSFRSRQSGDWDVAATWEEFVAGSWQLTANTPTSGSGTITIQGPHVVTVTTAVTIDQTTIQAGATLTVNNTIVLTLGNGTGADLTNSGTLNLLGEAIINGTGNIVTNGTLRLGSLNATGALVSGTTAGNIRVSSRTYNSGAFVVYAGTGPQFIGSGHPNGSSPGVTTTIDNGDGVTFNTTTLQNIPSTGTLVIPGDLVLTDGNFNVISSSGSTRTLNLNGQIIDNGNFITVSGPRTNLSISGSGDIPDFPFEAGTHSLSLLVINRAANTVAFSDDLNVTTRLTVSGNVVFGGSSTNINTVQLNSGSIDFNGTGAISGPLDLANATTIFFEGQSLSMSNFNSAGGVLSSDASSTLLLGGNSALATPLVFAGGSQLQALSVNKNTAGTSAVIGSEVTVTSALDLTMGSLSIVGGNLTLANGATITMSGNGSIVTSSPSGGPWNLVYTGSSQTTGLEVPASGQLNNLTVSTNLNTTVTLDQDLDVAGAFVISSGGRVFTSGANNVTVGSFFNAGTFNAPTAAASVGLTTAGSFANNGTFNHNNGTVVIAGAVTMSGTDINTTNFNNLDIEPAGVLTAPAILNIQGNFSNDGGFVAGGNLVVFSGNSTLSGSTIGTTAFNNVTIGSGAVLVPGENLTIGGNFAVNGTYSAGAGTTTFAGTTALSGTNINTTEFNNVVVSGGSTLTANITFVVGGNLTIDGTFSSNASAIISFDGTTVMGGTAINTTTFNNVVINNLATVTAPATFNILGNLTNDGTFNANGGLVVFTGSIGAKVLSGTSNTQFFDVRLVKTNTGTSLTVSSPQTVTNSLLLSDGILSNAGNNLAVSAGATVTRSHPASVATSAISGGPYHLVYTNNNQTTGFEIPASGVLQTLTLNTNNGRTITLSQSIDVLDAFTISNAGRTFTSNANDVSVGSFFSAGTFNAPNASATIGMTVSGDFTNNGIFNAASGTIIFDNVTNIGGTSQTIFNHIQVTGTANALTNFSLRGNLTVDGLLDAGLSTITFNGTTLQTIGGTSITTFNDLMISNTSSPVSVSVESDQFLAGVLTLAGSAKFDADGSADAAEFTLLSSDDSPADDAVIATIPAGAATVMGNVTVQRFMGALDAVDRFISTPVANAPVSDLQDDFAVTGSFVGTSFPCPGCQNNGASLYWYDESLTGAIANGYTAFPVASNTETLVPGRGYDNWMWNGTAPITIDLRGPVNQGTVNFTISHTPSVPPNPDNDGWNLIGNPYPSAIAWNNGAGWTKNEIAPIVYVWDGAASVYRTYNADTEAGDLTGGVIVTGQAFWVYANQPGASMSINENAKTLSSGSFYREARPEPAGLMVSLTHGNSTDNSFVMEAKDPLSMSNGPKLIGRSEKLAVAPVDTEGRKLVSYAIDAQQDELAIPLFVSGTANGAYVLSFFGLGTSSLHGRLFLEDLYLGTKTRISGNGYHFTMTDNPATRENRFRLTTTPGLPADEVVLSIAAYPNPVSSVLKIEINSDRVSSVVLMDNLGRNSGEVRLQRAAGLTTGAVDMTGHTTGVYFIRAEVNDKVVVQKIIKN